MMDETPAVAPRPARDLADAMRRARLLQAERSAVVADLKAAEIARLEALEAQIGPVLAQAPERHRVLFEGGLVPSDPPRLWIDILAFVEMGHDKRTYVFVREGREARATLYETADLDDMVERLVDYIAHRVIERERALAEDAAAEPWPGAVTGPQPAAPPAPARAQPIVVPAAEPVRLADRDPAAGDRVHAAAPARRDAAPAVVFLSDLLTGALALGALGVATLGFG
jgi:hypothetical protein